MTSRNDITGDSLVTKSSTDAYRDGWDRIFGKKKKADVKEVFDTVKEAHDLGSPYKHTEKKKK